MTLVIGKDYLIKRNGKLEVVKLTDIYKPNYGGFHTRYIVRSYRTKREIRLKSQQKFI